jgi:starvation-inducible DNA-binding protein
MRNRYQPQSAKLPEEIQTPKDIRELPLGMEKKAIKDSLKVLEQTLVESYMMYALYKKHHWQLIGPTFYQLHLLFDKHAAEQLVLIDALAERMQILGGVAIAMPHDIAERTEIERPPGGAESIPAMLTRLVEVHGKVIEITRKAIDTTEENEDHGSNDFLASDVLRTNELQLWFVSSHLADGTLTEGAK